MVNYWLNFRDAVQNRGKFSEELILRSLVLCLYLWANSVRRERGKRKKAQAQLILEISATCTSDPCTADKNPHLLDIAVLFILFFFLSLHSEISLSGMHTLYF